jgi:CheY-like chemotaxis protein
VSRGRVLVIDGDERLGPSLARAFGDRGFVTDLRSEARAGFETACKTFPDCVVCAIDLPDIDGFWVARRIRTELGVVSKTPIVFLADEGHRSMLTQALHVGADVVLERPVGDAHVVAQVEALIAFAQRLHYGQSSQSVSSSSSTALTTSAAIRGDISMFPIASILMMFEMERRTGTIEVVAASGTRAVLTLSAGLFAATELGGVSKPPLEVLREVLSWRAGRFSFRPREVGSIPPPRGSVGALVLEAMRLEDEKNNAAS